MEIAYFGSIAALGFEILIFLSTIFYVIFKTLYGRSAWTSRLWWPVGGSVVAGVFSFLFSFRYVVKNPSDQDWIIFFAASVILPIILAVLVAVILKKEKTVKGDGGINF